MCVLEIVFSLTLDYRVSDAGARGHASFEGNVGVASLLQWLRKAMAVAGNGAAVPGASASDASRERAHLFLLYGSLVTCGATREARVRERVRDVLRLAGGVLRTENKHWPDVESPPPPPREGLLRTRTRPTLCSYDPNLRACMSRGYWKQALDRRCVLTN